jgi:hypothetical protein
MSIFSKIFSGAKEGEDNENSEESASGGLSAAEDAPDLAEGTIDETPSAQHVARPTPPSIPAQSPPARRIGQKPLATAAPEKPEPKIKPAGSLPSLTPASTSRPQSAAQTEPTPAPTRSPAARIESKAASKSTPARAKRSTGQQIENAFDVLESGDSASDQQLDESDQRAAQEAAMETFRGVAAWYVSHVRNLMLEVKWGTPSTSWLQGCERSIRSLSRFAREVEWQDLAEKLSDFSRALSRARSRGPRVEGDIKDDLMAAYAPLVEILPSAFELGEEKERREPIIVRSLLLQVPGVETVEIDRLTAAGLSTLETLFAASPDEIAATSGIPEDLAQNIVEHLHTYQSGPTSALTCEPGDTLGELRQLTESLEGIQNRFEEAAAGWSNDVRKLKRDLRRQRERTMLSVNIALARLGEVDRLSNLGQLPFEERIANLNAYLRDAERQQKALGRA